MRGAAMSNKLCVRENADESEFQGGVVLSERDRRMLKEIEKGLCVADPAFVRWFRAAVAHAMGSPHCAPAAAGSNKARVGAGSDSCLVWAWQYLAVLW